MASGKTFEERKQAALSAAAALGIVDVTADEKNGISPETVELAAKLMRKHGDAAYARLEARREAQKQA